MSLHTYRPSDLEPLTGAIRALHSIEGLPCIELRHAGEAFTLLASAQDVPPPLRHYYAKFGKKLTDTVIRLKKNLRSAESEAWKLERRINSAMDDVELTEANMSQIRHVNNRLMDLEKSLKEMADGMCKRLDGLDTSGVAWDEWDSTEIKLWIEIGPDAERPAYNPDEWAEAGLMEPIEICIRITRSWKLDAMEVKKPWGLDDGQNHSDMGGCEGHPMQHFNQCYLFHELWDHANVGLWGMLNLRALWIEIMPHRSGDFTI